MISVNTVRRLALAFPDTEEQPHFEKPSFRIKKKIFATVDEKHKRACLKLSLVEQSVFCSIDNEMIYPVPNAWGKQGWTFFSLQKTPKPILKDALAAAYNLVSTKKTQVHK